MALDRDDLDDTYDLLSPVRRSNSYSNRFESSGSEEETSAPFHTSGEVGSSPESLRSPSFPSSSRLHQPKYASTNRYQARSNVSPPPARKNVRKKKLVRHTSPAKTRTAHDTTRDLMKIPQDGDKTELSVWEDWLIRKVQEEREKLKLKKQSERDAKLEEERLEKEKEEKRRQEEINRQQWCEEKMMQAKLHRAMLRREELLKKELEAQKQQDIKMKAEKAYKKWMQKQQEIDQERKQKEEEQKQLALQEKEERRRKNEECFQKWLNQAKERHPVSPRPRSGDPRNYPKPAFRNPAPWIGPLNDPDTLASVRRQHRMMIAEKHAAIKKGRPQTAAPRQRKGLVTRGPEMGKGVLICRPATAAPLFHKVPMRNNKKFVPDGGRPARGRS